MRRLAAAKLSPAPTSHAVSHSWRDPGPASSAARRGATRRGAKAPPSRACGSIRRASSRTRPERGEAGRHQPGHGVLGPRSLVVLAGFSPCASRLLVRRQARRYGWEERRRGSASWSSAASTFASRSAIDAAHAKCFLVEDGLAPRDRRRSLARSRPFSRSSGAICLDGASAHLGSVDLAGGGDQLQTTAERESSRSSTCSGAGARRPSRDSMRVSAKRTQRVAGAQ